MAKEMLTGNAAAAWGVRLAEVDYIPAYPVTPQTEIIETIARWISNGDMDARFVTMDSEHSMITAAGSASATGVARSQHHQARVSFTALRCCIL